jgi:hypothetical protein
MMAEVESTDVQWFAKHPQRRYRLRAASPTESADFKKSHLRNYTQSVCCVVIARRDRMSRTITALTFVGREGDLIAPTQDDAVLSALFREAAVSRSRLREQVHNRRSA